MCYTGAIKPQDRRKGHPPVPFNGVVISFEYRSYKNVATGSLDMTLKQVDCHFRLRGACVRKRHPEFKPEDMHIFEVTGPSSRIITDGRYWLNLDWSRSSHHRTLPRVLCSHKSTGMQAKETPADLGHYLQSQCHFISVP